jgi:hypothetical protein
VMKLQLTNKSLAPVFVAVIAFLLSPEFYDKLPDKWAHIIAVVATVVAAVMPQLFEKEKKDVKEDEK